MLIPFLDRICLSVCLAVGLAACQQGPGDQPPSAADAPLLFTQLDGEATGIDFINKVTDTESFNVFTYRNYYNGGGVALGDINQDGLPDIYFTANMGGNKLYLNKGDWTFEDITETAGVAGTRAWSTGVAMADVNADGRMDIYVCNSGDVAGDNKENELFINNGDGTFSEQAAAYGLNDRGFSTHASFFDYDLDGDLDCYVLNNSFKDPRRMRLDRTKRRVMDPLGGDKLFRNDGGRFVNVTAEAGLYGSADGFGLGVSVSDLNGDLLPDIYISNDFWERDYLYINQGDGTFSEELTERLGLCPSSSMGADLADLNNDGALEIFTTDMLPGDDHRLKTMTMFDPYFLDELEFRETYYYQMMHNCLQVNEGNGRFQERAFLSGLATTDWSWGALLFDFDNDGLRDVLVSNGIFHNITDRDFTDFVSDRDNVRRLVEEKGGFDPRDLLPNLASTPLANYAFLNRGDLHFDNQAAALGLATPSFSNGAAYGDLDLDGDLDLIVNNLNMPSFVYRNEADQKTNHHYLRIDLKGRDRNPQGIGARVRIWYGDQMQVAHHYLTRGFESSVAPGLHFGLGPHQKVDRLEVIWPDRSVQTLSDIPADETVTLDQKDADESYRAEAGSAPLFEESTAALFPEDIIHRENDFNDFDHERLLIRMLSTEGPKIIAGDSNGDGLQDLVLLGAAGDRDKLLLQTPDGSFREQLPAPFAADRAQESTCGIFFDPDGDGDLDLLIGSGGNEYAKGPENLVIRLYENDGRGNFRKDPDFPKLFGNLSCIATGDFDQDGDPDLFLGARAIPGNYGLTPRSFLLRNDGGGLWWDITNEAIGTLGMVTDAAWNDVDLDGDPDLIVVGDWMPVTIIKNENFQLREKQTLPNSEGWWTCLETADLNGDGRDDLVLGNWGENSKFAATPDRPLELWAKDFDGNGKTEFILNWRPPLESELTIFSDKKELTAQLPHLRKKAVTYEEYAAQTYETLLSPEERKGAVQRIAKVLQSGIYWNRPAGFDWQALPVEAQVSPVFGLCVADLDGDGQQDIWLGGNLFALQPSVGHLSANHGVFLKGDGREGFTFQSPRQTGIYLRGEVRDVVWIPDLAGQPALLVARNNDSLVGFVGHGAQRKAVAQ